MILFEMNWQEVVVVDDLDGYTPPSDPDILGIFGIDICLDMM